MEENQNGEILWALKFGAKPPVEWSNGHCLVFLALDSLWDDLRTEWWESRKRERALEDEHGGPDLALARSVLDVASERREAAFQTRRAWRQQTRERGSTPEIEAEITEAIAEQRAARRTLGEVLRPLRLVLRPQLKEIWRTRDLACQAIACGTCRRYPILHDGSYNDLLRRYRIAAHKAYLRGRLVRPSTEHPSHSIYRQLKGRTVDGTRVEIEGRAKARIEGGMLVCPTWAELWRPGGVQGVSLTAHEMGDRITRRWALLSMPASAGGLMLRIPVRIDQEPPPETKLKGVRAVRGDDGWHVVFSVHAPLLRPIKRGRAILYVGVNWRRTSAGLRILDGIDTAGRRVQVNLPMEELLSVSYGIYLQSALDRAAELAASRLGSEALPLARRRDWEGIRQLALASEDPEMQRWVYGSVLAKQRHRALLSARLAAQGDGEKQAIMTAEILGDQDGRRWLAGHNRKRIRRREDLYRRAARWLAEQYGRIVVAESDGSRLAIVENQETGESNPLPLPARHARQLAAPYALQSALEWAVQKAGGELVRTPAVDYSHQCPVCRSEMHRRESDKRALFLRCSEHGVWDRDYALALALWRDDPAAAEDRERWSRQAHRKNRSQVKIVRVEAEVDGNLRGHGQPRSRLRHVTGLPLENGQKS